MAYLEVNGPSVITSSAGFSMDNTAPLTGNSFTLTAAQVAGGIIILNWQFNYLNSFYARQAPHSILNCWLLSPREPAFRRRQHIGCVLLI